MKILRTTATFYPHVTGPAYQAYKISEGVEKRGHESPIVTSNVVPAGEEPGYPPEMDGDDSFSFRIIRRKPLISIDQYRFPPRALYDYFHENPDIVHCHGYQNAIKDVFYLGKRLSSTPFVIHGHGSFSKENDPTIERSLQFDLYNKLWFRSVEHADAVVVSSEQEREDAISFGVSSDKLWKIPVGKVPSVYESVPRNVPEGCLRLLFVGRLAPRRNVELLIDAVAELDRDDVRLRIVGGEGTLSNSSRGNYISELKQRVANHNVDERVTFTGPKYGNELIKEYRTAHLFVNPTHYENFGQANLEAAFAGLPLVATPTGVAKDLIKPETGYTFKNQSQLTNRLSELADDHERIQQMSQNISEIAKRDYTWDTIIDQYCSLYQEIV
ncbi:glycosyltransferase family 4 protein [Haloarcula argentinensis]|uniref:Glycosyltransferase n=1 Tax=Haloarcula argentinensis TaxID=43776 RepID=A0A847ULH3_HALAR|nr:glycosyltransferase family 4 protein [Haloarcula argentinensis]NLV12630.1 glycosyltransferase [Haloarcula argentinensis]